MSWMEEEDDWKDEPYIAPNIDWSNHKYKKLKHLGLRYYYYYSGADGEWPQEHLQAYKQILWDKRKERIKNGKSWADLEPYYRDMYK